MWDRHATRKDLPSKIELRKLHDEQVEQVVTSARSLIEPGVVVGCHELARWVAHQPSMPSRKNVEDVLKGLSPGRNCIGLAKRYIHDLGGHPGHFFAWKATDFDRFISQRKAYRADIAKRVRAQQSLVHQKEKESTANDNQ